MQPIGAAQFRKIIENEGIIKAARIYNPSVETEGQAQELVTGYFQRLLFARKFAAAGLLAFGEQMFNPKVGSVKMILETILANPKVMIMAGGSVGKSYTAMGWVLLDWCMDPFGTTFKLISTTGGHAKSNTLATLKNLREKSIIPLPGFAKGESLNCAPNDERGAITIIKIAKGEDNSGVLQGFHPLPRVEPHPVLGTHTRVRALIDEAEEVPGGWITGADNMAATADDDDNLKIVGLFNPKDPGSRVADLCEPPTGWQDVDPNTGYRGQNKWRSKKGYVVLWIDPEKTENVQQRKTIYSGFQTRQGWEDYRDDGGGNSLSFWAFGKGLYPPEGSTASIFTQTILNNCWGEFIFTGRTIKWASLDTAFNGRDEAILTNGRFGRAKAFRLHVADPITGRAGAPHVINFAKERDVIQVDSQESIRRGNVSIVATDFRERCKHLGISPNWTMIDSTGRGEAVLGLLQSVDFWSPEVRGLNFGADATDTKVMEEDNNLCSDLYQGVSSEIWFAAAKLCEFGYVGIAPGLMGGDLGKQLIGRKYVLGEKKTKKVEDKELYKKRLGRSPDHADSMLTGVHLMRTHQEIQASMVDIRPEDSKKPKLQTNFWTQPQDQSSWVND